MTLILGTLLAGVLGLFFGSFLNVCVSRWPGDESVIKPPSHCSGCERTLAWWENIPVISWLALRGRCRTCGAWIGWRHLLVELGVGCLWAFSTWLTLTSSPGQDFASLPYSELLNGVSRLAFLWLLVGLAALDVENLWLPDRLIWPGFILGFLLTAVRASLDSHYKLGGGYPIWKLWTETILANWFVAVVGCTALLLIIRFLYAVIRRREGIGAGDVKLMAMLASWLGAKVALLDFAIGVITAAVFALILLSVPSMRAGSEGWARKKLPFGAFLCLGGVIGGFWGTPIVTAYARLAGF